MSSWHPWLVALSGGALIGLSAALLWWLDGRIAGVSNITAGLLTGLDAGNVWRAAFVLGLIAGAGLAAAWLGAAPVQRPALSLPLLAGAGLLVGYGTSLGSGCTSGHGVCGLARLSRRSIVATLVFLAVAVVTTFIVRHPLGVAT